MKGKPFPKRNHTRAQLIEKGECLKWTELWLTYECRKDPFFDLLQPITEMAASHMAALSQDGHETMTLSFLPHSQDGNQLCVYIPEWNHAKWLKII